MKNLVGDRLPQFTDAQKKQINGTYLSVLLTSLLSSLIPPESSNFISGSWDYFGLNHYTSGYSQNNPAAPTGAGWDTDQQVNVLTSRNGIAFFFVLFSSFSLLSFLISFISHPRPANRTIRGLTLVTRSSVGNQQNTELGVRPIWQSSYLHY